MRQEDDELDFGDDENMDENVMAASVSNNLTSFGERGILGGVHSQTSPINQHENFIPQNRINSSQGQIMQMPYDNSEQTNPIVNSKIIKANGNISSGSQMLNPQSSQINQMNQIKKIQMAQQNQGHINNKLDSSKNYASQKTVQRNNMNSQNNFNTNMNMNMNNMNTPDKFNNMNTTNNNPKNNAFNNFLHLVIVGIYYGKILLNKFKLFGGFYGNIRCALGNLLVSFRIRINTFRKYINRIRQSNYIDFGCLNKSHKIGFDCIECIGKNNRIRIRTVRLDIFDIKFSFDDALGILNNFILRTFLFAIVFNPSNNLGIP